MAEQTASDADPFGLYRAEWLSEEALFAWFKRPAYFPDLEAPVPCVLVGGRGTGKTTVLRCLSFEGRAALSAGRPSNVTSWSYYGFYHRINSNRVRAFRGGDIAEHQWTPLFSHYVNLLLCGKVLSFLLWYETTAGRQFSLAPEFFEDIASSLRISQAGSLRALARLIERALIEFEAFLNDLDFDSRPPLSLQGQPIDIICKSIGELPDFRGKQFFFILDEFENLLDYQQIVFNTLIKHCSSHYSFKIGVRELGWRKKSTMNEGEFLSSPADYSLIDIGSVFDHETFLSFAEDICNKRSGLVVSKLFPGLSLDEEARLLGVTRLTDPIKRDYVGKYSDALAELSPLELLLADSWARQSGESLESILAIKKNEIARWRIRYLNYSYALLFTIRRGRPGVRKYYAGWRTFALMADGNIRFLLELVYQARAIHRRNGGREDQAISPEHQTEAAIDVGRKYIEELSGTSVLGGQLTRLLLGVGRVFEVMAAQPEGHTPEVNQFHIDDSSSGVDPLLVEILEAAVMNLAVVRSIANKRSKDSAEIKDYDYAPHPIYSAFFGYSHRRKRKMRVSSGDLLSLVDSTSMAIDEILKRNNRSGGSELPTQLQLFAGVYGDNS